MSLFPLVHIIADDFTGAMGCTAYFNEKGYKARLQVKNDNYNLEGVTVINTDTRDSNDNYRDKLLPFLTGIRKSTWLFKKIDSTLRGNIGEEIESLMELSEAYIAVVIPSIPESGRIVKNDTLYVNNKPLHLSEMVEDFPEKLNHSKVSKLIKSQTNIDVKYLEKIEGFKRECKINQKSIFCFDAISQKEIEQLVDRILKMKENGQKILWVGSIGLAKAIANYVEQLMIERHYHPEDALSDLVFPGENVKTLIINGSKKEVSHLQIRRLAEANIVKKVIINDKGSDKYIYNPNDTLICITSKIEDEGIDKSISSKIANVSLDVIKRQEINFIVFIGGYTAWKVIKLLDVKSIEIKGIIYQGLSIGVIHLNNGNQLYFLAKGGGIGDEKTLVETYRLILSTNSPEKVEQSGGPIND